MCCQTSKWKLNSKMDTNSLVSNQIIETTFEVAIVTHPMAIHGQILCEWLRPIECVIKCANLEIIFFCQCPQVPIHVRNKNSFSSSLFDRLCRLIHCSTFTINATQIRRK